MSNDFDHLHLKRNTAGTSNELTFDVLDAASSGISPKKEKDAGARRFSKKQASEKKQSKHEAQRTPTLSGQEEVERRKQKRRSHAKRTWALGILLTVAAVAAIAWFAIHLETQAKSFSVTFDGLVARSVEQDEVLSEVDALMADPLREGSGQTRSAVLEKIPASRNAFEQVKSGAQAAEEAAVNDQDRVAVNQLAEAASARVEMLDQAQEALTLAAEIEKSSEELEKVWGDAVAADQLMREATAEFNAATTEKKVSKALDKTKEAQEAMAEAQGSFVQLAETYSNLDLSAQTEYLKVKLDSFGYAVEAGEAVLAGKKKRAKTKNEDFNKADQRAAQLASSLPRTMGELVQSTYDEQLSTLETAYVAAREKAVSADAVVRGYLAA